MHFPLYKANMHKMVQQKIRVAKLNICQKGQKPLFQLRYNLDLTWDPITTKDFFIHAI